MTGKAAEAPRINVEKARGCCVECELTMGYDKAHLPDYWQGSAILLIRELFFPLPVRCQSIYVWFNPSPKTEAFGLSSQN